VTEQAGFVWPRWLKGSAIIAALVGGGGWGLSALVLEDDPEPCKPGIMVGRTGLLSCPHPDHYETGRHPYAPVPSIECECANMK